MSPCRVAVLPGREVDAVDAVVIGLQEKEIPRSILIKAELNVDAASPPTIPKVVFELSESGM